MTTQNIRILRHALIFTGAVVLGVGLYGVNRYFYARNLLAQIDLQARNVSGATFYAAPKRVAVGQALTRPQLIAHLKEIGYSPAASGDAGTYATRGANELFISPRLPEFPSVGARFAQGQVVALSVNGQPAAAEALVEPLPLGAFIYAVKDDGTPSMFVRRHVADQADVINTNLYFVTLASEDATFHDHHGIRYERVLRSLLPGGKGGASSISMQVIKNAVSLNWRKTYLRKADEMMLAAMLEQQMSKDEIFTLYANSVYLGRRRGGPHLYGFLAAAEDYFGRRNLKDLTLEQAATLVAMLPKPSYFAPLVDKSREDVRNSPDLQARLAELKADRNRILDSLNKYWPDKFPADQTARAKNELALFTAQPSPKEQQFDYLTNGFVDYAAQQPAYRALAALPAQQTSGAHIYTTLDPDLTRAAESLLSRMLPALEKEFPPAQAGGCQGKADRLLGTIVALDPQTGAVVTMYGGAGGRYGYKYSKLALSGTGAMASTWKPFLYAATLGGATLPDGQRITAATMLDPRDGVLNGWSPRAGVGAPGLPRTLLSKSDDGAPVFLLQRLGIKPAAQLYEDLLGVKLARERDGSVGGLFALGFWAGGEVSALQSARAYTLFARQGSVIEPTPFGQVYLDGVAQPAQPAATRTVPGIGPAESFITREMLTSVLGQGPDGAAGTARAAYQRAGLPPDVAISGKTGSGPDAVWMVSVSPRLVVSVWLGYQCHSEINNQAKLFAANSAALVWAEFMRAVSKQRPDLLAGRFTPPENVTEISFDPTRGCRADGPAARREWFIKGTEPPFCDAVP